MSKPVLQLTPEDRTALAQMAYGENASEDNDTIKMTVQSAINRLKSGRAKEFGATIPEVLKKGYYAVSKNSPLYQQAVSKKLPDFNSKKRYGEIEALTNAIIDDQDFGNTMFYFKPSEASSLKKKLKRQGTVGQYETYSY